MSGLILIAFYLGSVACIGLGIAALAHPGLRGWPRHVLAVLVCWQCLVAAGAAWIAAIRWVLAMSGLVS